jgi:hypothetical protein
MNPKRPVFALLTVVAAVAFAADSAAAAEAAMAKEAQAPKPKLVKMLATDGKKITGWLWGKGETALILCHGRAYATGGDSFARECQYFAAKGIRCLALNFRGYPAEAPPTLPGKENDIMAAFGHLATRGARRIFVLGSSIAQPQFRGIIILSAFDKSACDQAPCPKLFFYAQDDARLYKYVQMMFYKAAPPKRAVVFETGGHGQMLLKSHGQQIVEQIHLFMKK